MDPNRLTLKSREALQRAQDDARRRNHQQVEPEHLLLSLLGDPEGVVYGPGGEVRLSTATALALLRGEVREGDRVVVDRRGDSLAVVPADRPASG